MITGPDARKGAVTYLGHATTLIEIDGVKLLTDPVLRNRVAHLRRHAPAPAVDGLAPDAVLVSHAHRDHLDLPSLRVVARGCPVIVPRGCGRLTGRSAGEVIEVDVGDRVRVKTLEVTATFARHDGRRNPLGQTTPALGFEATGSLRAYFAGDTDLFPEMAALAGGLDLALLPVAGWGPNLGPGHLDPERAARAAALLRPRIAVPIHWGTFAPPGARPDDPEAPAREFEREAALRAPEVDVRVLRPGELLRLGRAS
jgi:L-ascorbate metabolism protein UlaG (beta-lactamase superfamily)